MNGDVELKGFTNHYYGQINLLDYLHLKIPFLHMSCLSFFTSDYPTQGLREPGVYPRGIQAQGGGHTGQGAKTSQGMIAHTHLLMHYGQFRDAMFWTGEGNP